MDIRNLDPNLLRTTPIGGSKAQDAIGSSKTQDKTESVTQDSGFEKEKSFEDVLNEFINDKIEAQSKIDKGIVDNTTAGQLSAQVKLSRIDGFQRGGETSDWNPAGIG